MNRMKWIGGSVGLCILLFMGWMFQVKGEENSITASFADQREETYITNTRKLEITLHEDQEAENMTCLVNGEEVMIEWGEERKGYVLFEENGWYKVKLQYLDSEYVMPEFCIDKDRPTKPKVESPSYEEGTWTKHSIEVFAKNSTAISEIERYEYKLDDTSWKTMEENKVFLEESYVGNLMVRSVSKAGLKSESVSILVKLWKENPENISIEMEKENEYGWYTKCPDMKMKQVEQKKGPRVSAYIQVEKIDSGSKKTYVNELPELTKDGIYRMTWWTEDELSHKSEKHVKKEIKIDQTKPEINFRGDISKEVYRNQRQKIWIYMKDTNLSKERSKIETTGDIKQGEEIQVVFDKEGENGCEVTAIDEAGNETKRNIEPFVLDQTKPEVQIQNVQPLHSYRKAISPVVFWKDANLDFEKCEVWLDERKLDVDGDVSQGFKMEVTKDAHHLLRVKGEDLAGNTVENNILFTLNQKGSTIRLLTKNLVGKKVNQDTIEVKFQVDNIDPYRVESFRLNEKDVDFTQKNQIVTMKEPLKKDGTYNISFSVKDMSGNINDYNGERTFYYDGTPPELLILGVTSKGTYYGNQKVQIKTQKAEDEITKIRINDKEEQHPKNNQTIEFKKGKHTVWVWGKDEVGNQAKKTVTFEIKENQPLVQIQEGMEKIQELPRKVKEQVKNNSHAIFLLLFLSVVGGMFVFVKEIRKK